MSRRDMISIKKCHYLMLGVLHTHTHTCPPTLTHTHPHTHTHTHTPQTYIVSLDWTKICGPNWQFFDSTAEKQQKMCKSSV